MIGYLTSIAGLDDGVVDSNLSGLSSLCFFKPEGLEKLSQIYGLSIEDLKRLYEVNCIHLGSKKRSREVLNRLQKFWVKRKLFQGQLKTKAF